MPNKVVQFAYVGCSIWNIAFGEGLRTWTLFLEFIKNTERSWQVLWGQDVFRLSLFTAAVFRTIRFFCDFLYVIVVPFNVQSVYQESASSYLLLKKNIYNSLTVNYFFTRWFLLQGNFLVLAHRLLARISFKLRKIDSKHYYRYIIFVSIT